jgi:hypothetical protein
MPACTCSILIETGFFGHREAGGRGKNNDDKVGTPIRAAFVSLVTEAVLVLVVAASVDSRAFCRKIRISRNR